MKSYFIVCIVLLLFISYNQTQKIKITNNIDNSIEITDNTYKSIYDAIFFEKSIKSSDSPVYHNTDDCDPKCINGVCSDGNCFCKLMWSGLDCGIGK